VSEYLQSQSKLLKVKSNLSHFRISDSQGSYLSSTISEDLSRIPLIHSLELVNQALGVLGVSKLPENCVDDA
jgi:hypothetical protein